MEETLSKPTSSPHYRLYIMYMDTHMRRTSLLHKIYAVVPLCTYICSVELSMSLGVFLDVFVGICDKLPLQPA